jgi:GAF domain-containing protein
MHAHLSVPMLLDGNPVGAITVARREAKQFSETQIELLKTFAAQAVIAMENARLITETREALEQQTATAEVLQVINSSPGDLAPVFEAMLEKAMRLCTAAFGYLMTFDGRSFQPVAHCGLPAPFADYLPRMDQPGPSGAYAQIRAGVPLVHVVDLKEGEVYRTSPLRQALVDLGGARTGLIVALRKDDSLLGVFTIYRQEVRPFAQKEIALLQNFAAQAVIAMENARLITETREALEQQTATAEVLGVINSSPGDLAPVFDAILENAHNLCGIATGSLQLYDGNKFRAVAVHGMAEQMAVRLRQGYSPTPEIPTWQLLEGRRWVHIPDIAEIDHPLAHAVAEAGMRTLLCVALRKDDQLLGQIVGAWPDVRASVEKEAALLQNFAAQAVIAMENARLITETREALEQQTATAEVLGVINNSPGDLVPVFNAMLEKATTLCEAAHGALFIRDGESDRFHAIPSQGTPKTFAEFLTREPVYFDPERSIIAQTLRQRSAIQIADMRLSEPYRNKFPIALAAVESGGTRTLLSVPLFRDDAPVGIFQLARQEVRPFSDKQIALLQNFAAQAVIAIENVRLITETREALEQQTATAEVLGVINSSPGDLAPVFDAMLDRASELCGAAFGCLWTYDGERMHAAALRGAPPDFAEFLTRAPHPVGPENAHGRLLRGDPLVHIADVADDEAYRAGDPVRRHLVELGGGRTLLAVPLRKEDRFLGDFVMYRTEVRPFSDKQIALLQNFAAQAVIAMENARLLGELRQRTGDLQESLEYQTATSDVLKVISRSTFDLQPVLDALVATAARLTNADQALIASREGDIYRAISILAVSPEQEAFLRGNNFVPGRGSVVGRVVLSGQIVQIPDLAADPEYVMLENIRLGGTRTVLGVPLLREGEPIGVLNVARQRVEPFTEKQIQLVTTFADQAVIAIENVRLLNDLQGRTRDLQESLEHQTATSDVLKVISRSGGELEAVLDTLVKTAARLCDAEMAFIHRREGEVYRPAAVLGFPEEFTAYLEAHPVVLSRGSITGRVALEGRAIHIADVAEIRNTSSVKRS